MGVDCVFRMVVLEEEKVLSSRKRKNVKLRRALKQLPCVACGTLGTDWNPVDPAHIRTFKVTQSDHPANVVSLCRDCHKTQHKEGWEAFLANNPVVWDLLLSVGWDITQHPFQAGKLIMAHPEIE